MTLGSRKTTVDIRGYGGCIIVAPTVYTASPPDLLAPTTPGVGELRYSWEVDLPAKADLSPVPDWWIEQLNADSGGSSGSGGGGGGRSGSGAPQGHRCTSHAQCTPFPH